MKKSALRKIYLAKQKNLSSAERKQKSEKIASKFFAHFDLSKINFLHCFLPIEKFNEINTHLIFQIIWRKFPQLETLAPRVNFQTGNVENLVYKPETKLVKNVWEIFEPAHNTIVETEKIDLVLIPLLCFDERGFRVGYGKGFYDKFLSHCRNDCTKIGLSYLAPIEKISDTQDFDVKLDFCVTPEMVLQF